MKLVRTYYFKLLVFTLIMQAILLIWGVAEPIQQLLWWLLLALFILWLVPHPGYPVFWLWLKFKNITSQGMRFFMGTGLFIAFVVLYLLHPEQYPLYYLPVLFSYPEETTLRVFFWLALLALSIGLVRPVADFIFSLWMRLAHGLSFFVSKILITVIYIISVIPVFLLARLVGKRFLTMKIDSRSSTYWVDRSSEQPTMESYLNKF